MYAHQGKIQYYFEILLQFKIPVFYLNIFHMYSCDGKTEFSAASYSNLQCHMIL